MLCINELLSASLKKSKAKSKRSTFFTSEKSVAGKYSPEPRGGGAIAGIFTIHGTISIANTDPAIRIVEKLNDLTDKIISFILMIDTPLSKIYKLSLVEL